MGRSFLRLLVDIGGIVLACFFGWWLLFQDGMFELMAWAEQLTGWLFK